MLIKLKVRENFVLLILRSWAIFPPGKYGVENCKYSALHCLHRCRATILTQGPPGRPLELNDVSQRNSRSIHETMHGWASPIPLRHWGTSMVLGLSPNRVAPIRRYTGSVFSRYVTPLTHRRYEISISCVRTSTTTICMHLSKSTTSSLKTCYSMHFKARIKCHDTSIDEPLPDVGIASIIYNRKLEDNDVK